MITRREIPAWLPLALLGLIAAALFYRLLDGQTLFWGLPTLQFYPWRQFAFAELRAGHLPVWNPYLGAGAPLLANYQTAVFYPPNWLFLVLPGPQAMSWGAVLHVFWAGLGMWLFAGALGLTSFGRGMSTLAYALSGYMIARLGSFPTADAVAWMPWVIWLVHRTVTRRDRRAAGWLALAFGLQLLAGHAQTTWYSTLGAGLYAVWQVIWGMREPPRVRAGALLLAGAGMLLGVAIAATQLVPTAEYVQQSQRSGGLDYETLTNFSYHPVRLLTLLSPGFFGTPADGSYLTRGTYFEDAAYTGFIPFVSALAAVIGWLRKRKSLDKSPAFASVPFWALLALVALLVATGRHGPFFRPLYDTVPTFDTFRDPVRWLILTVFSLSVLAGIGVQQWGRGRWVVFWSRLAAAGGGAMVVMTVAALHVASFDSENLRVLSWGMAVLGCWITGAALLTLAQPVEPSPVSPVLWRTAVLLFVALDLGWMASGLNPTVPTGFFKIADQAPSSAGRIYWYDDYEYRITFGSDADDEPPIDGFFDVADYRQAVDRWRAARASLLPNINMLDRVPSLNNNDPLLPAEHSRYLDLIETLGADAGSLLRAAGVTRAFGITPEGWQGENPAVAPGADSVTLAWLVPQTVWLDGDPAMESALRDPGWDPLRVVFLAGSRDDQNEPAAVPVTGSVTVLQDDPTTRRYRVISDGPAYLVISQSWYPGWTARLNGHATALYRANLAFQAVAIPPGESEVTLQYRLNHWRVGLGVTFVALVIAACLILVPRLVQRQSHDAI